jgi:hypothetical protein
MLNYKCAPSKISANSDPTTPAAAPALCLKLCSNFQSGTIPVSGTEFWLGGHGRLGEWLSPALPSQATIAALLCPGLELLFVCCSRIVRVCVCVCVGVCVCVRVCVCVCVCVTASSL